MDMIFVFLKSASIHYANKWLCESINIRRR